MEFPRLVYKDAATHVLVENAAEHEKALAAGWHDSVPAALGQAVASPANKPAGKPAEDLGQAPAAVVAPVLTKAQEKAAKKAASVAVQTQAAPAAVVTDTNPVAKNPWD